MKKMLSVIVPVYNAAKFLPALFENFLSFPKEHVEIILVNDGSTDDGQILCERMIQNAENFSLIKQVNAGVSHARNTGIECANSDYILFCDPDDKLYADRVFNLLESIIEQPGNHPDVISFSYETYFSDSKKIKNVVLDDAIYSGDDVIALFNNYCKINNLSTVWNKIFKTSLIRNHNIRFDESMHHSEDRIFNIEVFGKANIVMFRSLVCYQYIKYTQGTLSTNYSQSRALSMLKADQVLIDSLSGKGVDSYYLYDHMIMNYIFLSCENAIRGKNSIFNGLHRFKENFYKIKIDHRIELKHSNVITGFFCFWVNKNSPSLFYLFFLLKLTASSVLNRIR